MRVINSIYGEFVIEDILKDLIYSKPVQRLKRIHQGGATFLVNKRWNTTRYQHSIGVMLLIKLLNGSILDQIKGLLHDISHTAFSHIIDYVYSFNDEDFHEHFYQKIVRNSEIPDILSKHGYKLEDILNYKCDILEEPLPNLSADRIDYTLLDMYNLGVIKENEIKNFLSALSIKKGKIVIDSIPIAEWFVEIYYKEVIGYFQHPKNVYSAYIMTKVIREAINRQILKLEDLFQDDYYVLEKLVSSNNRVIIDLLNKLNNKIEVVDNTNDFNISLKHKKRIIDPLIINKNKIIKSSSVSKKIKMLNQLASRKFENVTCIKRIQDDIDYELFS